jgi:hypothetical protein
VNHRRRVPHLLGSAGLVVAALLTVLPGAAAGQASSPTASGRTTARPLAERVQLGTYADGMGGDPSRLAEWEAEVGGRAEIASHYYGFGDVFPSQIERQLSDRGTRKVLLAWNMGPTRFTEWSSGDHDDYLDRIAAAARAYPYLVYVRPWPEMNGDWQNFQPTADGSRPYGGTYRQFKLAWRHVVTYLRNHGADNLRWVFNPDAATHPGTTPVSRIWPGSAYVDVLGLDGFNWGRDASWGRWLSFASIFRGQYDRLTALDPRAPVWICEVSSKEPEKNDGAPADPDHTKAAWIRGMLDYEGMPRLRAVVWFDADKERDWRATSSLGSQRAWQRAMSTRAAATR